MAVIYGTNSGEFIQGTDGADTIYGWAASNPAGDFGPGSDNDYLQGGGNDLVSGGGGDDGLYTYGGNDTLLGGDGNDVLNNYAFFSHTEPSFFYGGAGIDTYFAVYGPDFALVFSVADMQRGVTLADGTVLKGIEIVQMEGSDLDDSMVGGWYDDVLSGGYGNDTLRGGDGNDMLTGDGGHDQIFGGNGDDTVSVGSTLDADVVRGGLGIDLLIFDVFSVLPQDVTLAVSYSMTLPDGTTATGFERLDYQGTWGTDHITGGNWDDTLRGGGGGADVLTGRGGNDLIQSYGLPNESVTLYGGAGDDTLQARFTEGSLISGGDGIDLLVMSMSEQTVGVTVRAAQFQEAYTTSEGAVVKGFERIDLYGTAGDDQLSGGMYADTLQGYTGEDSLSGGAGNDYLTGGLGNDTLFGGDGDDWLYDWDGANVMFGAGGNDLIEVSRKIINGQFLYGGAGDDSLTGGQFGDIVNGGAGHDDLRGGAGPDRFTFDAPGEADWILDFGVGADVIVLKAAGFAGLGIGALSADDFVQGTAALDASDRILYDGTAVWYDSDGVGGASAVRLFTLTGPIGADDFLTV